MGTVMTSKKQKEEFARIAREAAGEGAVLLKNEAAMLPILAAEKVSVFGRCQIDYYRSGTGSGGSVRVPYTTSLLSGLREMSQVVNEELAAVYERWLTEHPFADGNGGWAAEPWHQEEMPVTAQLVQNARAVSDKAIVVIGRTAGEDKDNAEQPGSLRLTGAEEELLAAVNTYFERVAVVLNVSNLIEMSFMDVERLSVNVKAVLYAWQGGMEGGNAIAELLLGTKVPGGKLPDTITGHIGDHPALSDYGDRAGNCYREDIYVGYRYFSTFDPGKIRYEFGFGRSYTEFTVTTKSARIDGEMIRLTVTVQNSGPVYPGKEVVQIYYEAPQGRLGQPARQLLAWRKTGLLAPGAVQELVFSLEVSLMKTYDDAGVTGAGSAYVMEAGDYHLYVGNSSINNERVLTYPVAALRVIERLNEALAPVRAFERMKPGARRSDGSYELGFQPVPLRTAALSERIMAGLPAGWPQTGNCKITLAGVKDGKATLADFIAQLSTEELAMIVRGEGMEHPDVTPGTASAFGGVGETLLNYGIPLACTADGPSGIRMSAPAAQVPIGTLLAATFNEELIERLYVMVGRECKDNNIDLLLGPGMNIHRCPLNGRNFEYFSEDPLLTGKMAAAVVRGIARGGAAATVKHFAGNNQETGRTTADTVVSERAVREIYLRGFELAIREGGAKAVMTAYNPLNGHWTASNYDLNTTILRGEWGYDGIVMTDWWAKMNDVAEGGPADGRKMRDMVRAGNDLYMVVNSYGAEANSAGDDLLDCIQAGTLTIGELQQRAAAICRFLMNTAAMNRPQKAPASSIVLQPLKDGSSVMAPVTIVGIGENDGSAATIDAGAVTADAAAVDAAAVGAGAATADAAAVGAGAAAINAINAGAAIAVNVPVEMGKAVYLEVKTPGEYCVFVRMMSIDFNTAQVAGELWVNGSRVMTIAGRGSDGLWMTQKLMKVDLSPGYYCIRVKETQPHLVVNGLRFELTAII